MTNHGTAEKQKGVSAQSPKDASRKGERDPELSVEEKRVGRDAVSFQGLPNRPNLRVQHVVLMPRIKLNKFRLNAKSKVATRDGPGIANPQYGNGDETVIEAIDEFLRDMDSV